MKWIDPPDNPSPCAAPDPSSPRWIFFPNLALPRLAVAFVCFFLAGQVESGRDGVDFDRRVAALAEAMVLAAAESSQSKAHAK
jgi:hypothetical protein